MREVGILGGGISGLFTAYFLGGDVEVLEADATPGGLARCFGGGGFRSDIGGHILFSKDKEALSHEVAVLGENIRQGVRANKILYRGLHVKYPFENGIDVLPKEDIVDILYSFIDNPHKAQPTNFYEWMYHTFGDGLTDRYLLPYNTKIWKTPAEEMSLEWVDRVPRPPLLDLVRTAVGIQTEGYTHQLHFQYPDVGGFESLPRAVAAEDRPEALHRVPGWLRSARATEVGSSSATVARRGAIGGSSPRSPSVPCSKPSATSPPASPTPPARSGTTPSAWRSSASAGRTSRHMYGALRPRPGVGLSPSSATTAPLAADMVPPGYSSVSQVRSRSRPGASSTRCRILRCSIGSWTIWRETRSSSGRPSATGKCIASDTPMSCTRLATRDRVRSIREYTDSRGIHLAGRFAEYQYVNTDACVRRVRSTSRASSAGARSRPEAAPVDMK